MIPQFFCLRQQLGITRLSNIWDTLILKKTFVVYLKFRFSPVFSIVSGNPTAITFLLGGDQLTQALLPDPGCKQDQGRCLWEQASSHPIALLTATPEQERTLPSHSTFLSSGTQQIKISPDLFRQKSSKLYLIWSHFFLFFFFWVAENILCL